MRRAPSPEVAAWVSRQPSELLFTASVCQAEILAGIAVLPDYCVQPDSGLVRLLPQADMPEMYCFLVYTEELKNVARVHAFRDFLVTSAQRWRY